MSKHRIEDMAKVYLVLSDDGTRWEIDPNVVDTGPLDGYETGADIQCGNWLDDCDGSDCEAARDRASREVPLPDARQLYDMLADYYGD